jgi:hypothetical protein
VPVLYITDGRRTKIKLASRPAAAGINNCGASQMAAHAGTDRRHGRAVGARSHTAG